MDARGPTSLALSPAFKVANPAKAYLYDDIAAFNPSSDSTLGSLVFSPDVLIPFERLRDIACPVLIIAAEDDMIWPPAALADLTAGFNNARTVIVSACGHSPYFEQPALFNGILQDFMEEIRQDQR